MEQGQAQPVRGHGEHAQAHIGGGALPSLVDAVCDGVPRSQQEGDEHDKQAEVQVQRDPVLPIQHEAVLSPAAARRPAERYEERHGECQRHDRRRCDGREILLELHVVPVVLHKIIVRRQGPAHPVLGGEGDRSDSGVHGRLIVPPVLAVGAPAVRIILSGLLSGLTPDVGAVRQVHHLVIEFARLVIDAVIVLRQIVTLDKGVFAQLRGGHLVHALPLGEIGVEEFSRLVVYLKAVIGALRRESLGEIPQPLLIGIGQPSLPQLGLTEIPDLVRHVRIPIHRGINAVAVDIVAPGPEIVPLCHGEEPRPESQCGGHQEQEGEGRPPLGTGEADFHGITPIQGWSPAAPRGGGYTFSILYPRPQTTLMYLGLAGSISIFSLR